MDTPTKRDFGRLWGALSISLVGSQVTILALPLMASLTLGASALEMGALAAAGQVPFFLFSLPAGVWLDRIPRRPVLIAVDLGSGALLLTVPLAVLFGGPSFVHLCLVAFGVGAMAVVSEIAHYAYVPALVGRASLTRCNSKLHVSYSASEAAGPGLGGLLIQLLSAPIAVLVDAASFFASAVLLRRIRRPEAAPPREGEDPSVRRSLRDGLRMLMGHRLLRPIIVGGATATLFESGFLALFILYATRDLGLGPSTIGLIFAAGGVGAIPGALVADRLGKRWGVGPVIIAGWTVASLATILVPLVNGSVAFVVVALAVAKATAGLADTVANIHQWTLRQVLTPDSFAGRVTASHRFIVFGASACGAVLAGAAGTAIGLRAALLVCAVGTLAGPLVTLASPLRRLHRQPSEGRERRLLSREETPAAA